MTTSEKANKNSFRNKIIITVFCDWRDTAVDEAKKAINSEGERCGKSAIHFHFLSQSKNQNRLCFYISSCFPNKLWNRINSRRVYYESSSTFHLQSKLFRRNCDRNRWRIRWAGVYQYSAYSYLHSITNNCQSLSQSISWWKHIVERSHICCLFWRAGINFINFGKRTDGTDVIKGWVSHTCPRSGR